MTNEDHCPYRRFISLPIAWIVPPDNSSSCPVFGHSSISLPSGKLTVITVTRIALLLLELRQQDHGSIFVFVNRLDFGFLAVQIPLDCVVVSRFALASAFG